MVLWLFNGGNFLCRAQPLHLCTNARCITTPAGGRAEKQTRRLLTTKAPVLKKKRGRDGCYLATERFIPVSLRTPPHIHCLKVDTTHTPETSPAQQDAEETEKKREHRVREMSPQTSAAPPPHQHILSSQSNLMVNSSGNTARRAGGESCCRRCWGGGNVLVVFGVFLRWENINRLGLWEMNITVTYSPGDVVHNIPLPASVNIHQCYFLSLSLFLW